MSKNFLLRFFTSLLLGSLIFFTIYLESFFFNLLLLIIFFIGLYEIYKINNIFLRIVILLLFSMFIYSSYSIYALDYGKVLIIYILCITSLSDIGGYIFGKIIGGKKINFISPSKTYSGFFGSLLFVQIGGIYLKSLNLDYVNEMYFSFFTLLIFSLIVICGDLLFSYFKRICCIKDYSNFFPGHGGLFDRIDGLILLTIVNYIIIL